MYDELVKLDTNVLYYDIDSVIYISNGRNDPPLGNYLGDFTDELDGEYIVEFVALGPKNYAYLTSSGHMVCKIRGFTLNHKNSQVLNFEVLKEIVQTSDTKVIETENFKITRDIKKMKINTKIEKKRYKFNFDKRVIRDDFFTFPYGYE